MTDSTAYLPEGFAERFGVRMVPLHVLVDGESGLDGVEFGPRELAAALGAHRRVTTSRPSTDELAAGYRAALAAGADVVVAVHLSASLSGTVEAARVAAGQVNAERDAEAVRVVDSRSTAMGLGFAVLAAASAATGGRDPGRVERLAGEIAARTRTYFSVRSMEYLRRGGRVGAAAALLGTALSVKPLLHVADGNIVAMEKVRTTARAVSRLVELTAEVCPDGPVALAVHHLGAPERAVDLATRLEERLPASTGCVVSEVGAVIGAHTGPGVLGVVALPGGFRTQP